MKYTMTLHQTTYDALRHHLNDTNNEAAAYLLGRLAITENETRILVQEVVLVLPDEILSASPVHLSITSSSYVRAIKASREKGMVFVFVHSHPEGPAAFSHQDDREEPDLFRVVHDRNPQTAHASVILAKGEHVVGRAWLPDGTAVPLERIRIVGDRWHIHLSDTPTAVRVFFDRQVLAFGSAIQTLLGRLHIGVVGAGGTGSAVCEQLIRLGVGQITVFDHDTFDDTNVNRVYGSAVSDHGTPKATLVERSAQRIGLETVVNSVPRSITFRSVAEQLRDCDLVFGCTDDQWGRSILTRLAIYYLIPVLDLGVLIDSDGLNIKSIHGRVTVLQPGSGCLFCRERISADRVAAESIRATDPARATELVEEGYLVGVDEPAPAVVAFTTGVAAAAVAELLDRFIGYKGDDPRSSEMILRFDSDAIGKNTRMPSADCFCADPGKWGAGDKKLFLGMTWRAEV